MSNDVNLWEWVEYKDDYVKPGFYYPSWRTELTARIDG